jgi:hypothetical protein
MNKMKKVEFAGLEGNGKTKAVAQRPWAEQQLESTRDAAHAWAGDHCGEFFFKPVNLNITID